MDRALQLHVALAGLAALERQLQLDRHEKRGRIYFRTNNGRCYRRWVERGLSHPELPLIRGAVQRNQLTGSQRFILEVEQRIGERILYRNRGRSRSAA